MRGFYYSTNNNSEQVTEVITRSSRLTIPGHLNHVIKNSLWLELILGLELFLSA